MFRRTFLVAVCALFTASLGASALAYTQNRTNFQQMSSSQSGKKKIDAANEQDPYAEYNSKIKKAYDEILKIQKAKEDRYKVDKDKLLKKLEKFNKQKEKLKDQNKAGKLNDEIDKLERQIKLRDQYSELPKMPESKLSDAGANDKNANDKNADDKNADDKNQ